MHLDYIDSNEYERRKLETIANLLDRDRTDIIYNGENLFRIGTGHSFGLGFFKEYITLSGIEAKDFGSFWYIDQFRYTLDDGEFKEVIINKIDVSDIDFNDFSLPMVEGFTEPISLDLVAVKPMKSKDDI